MLLSIIIPALEADYEFLRCYYSILSVLNNTAYEYEIVVITTNKNISTFNISASNINLIVEKENGIYNAINQGILFSKGRYILILGKDDILLNGLKDIMRKLEKSNDNVILCNVFYENGKLYRNINNKYFLLFKNWCQQGIIYEKETIKNIGFFNSEFIVQADHYLNIICATNKNIKITKYNITLAVYSNRGYSTYTKDLVFWKKYPEIIRNNYGIIFYFMIKILRFIKYLWKKI